MYVRVIIHGRDFSPIRLPLQPSHLLTSLALLFSYAVGYSEEEALSPRPNQTDQSHVRVLEESGRREVTLQHSTAIAWGTVNDANVQHSTRGHAYYRKEQEVKRKNRIEKHVKNALAVIAGVPRKKKTKIKWAGTRWWSNRLILPIRLALRVLILRPSVWSSSDAKSLFPLSLILAITGGTLCFPLSCVLCRENEITQIDTRQL